MKNASLFVGAVLSLLLTTSLAGCSSKEDRERKYLEKAQALLQQGDLVKAKVEVRNVLQMNNENAEALFLRASIAEQEENYTEMANYLRSAVAANPNHIPAQLRLSYFYFLFGSGADSVTQGIIDKVLEIDPTNVEAIVRGGELQLRQGNPDKAGESAQKARSIDSNYIPAIRLLAASKRENSEEALAVLDKGLIDNPGNPKLIQDKINLLQSTDNVKGIAELHESLIANHPDNLEYRRAYVQFLTQSGFKKEAEDYLLKSVEEHPDVQDYKLWLAQFLISTGQQEEAIEITSSFITQDSAEPEMFFLLSDVYMAINEPESARQPLVRLLGLLEEGSPETLEAKLRLARISAKTGDTENAEQIVKEILSVDRENIPTLLLSSRLSLAEGDADSAVIALRTVLKRDPDSQEAHLLLARAHESDGAMDLALDSYKAALELQPANTNLALKVASIYYNRDEPNTANRLLLPYLEQEASAAQVGPKLVSSLVELEDWLHALEVAETLEGQESNRSLGMYLKGGVLYERGDYEGAISVFESLLEIDPGSTRALDALARAITESEGEVAAREAIEDYAKANPDKAFPFDIIAAKALQEGNAQQALADYEKSISIDPSRINPYLAMSRIHQQEGDYTAALREIDRAIAVAPSNYSLLLLKAGLLEQNQEFQKAADVYRKILELSNNNSIAANNLAMLLVDKLDLEANTDEALALTQRFEESTEPVFLDTRGWVYYRAGDYENARRVLEKAVSDPGKSLPVYRYHLGLTYIALGMNDKAERELETALESGVKFDGFDIASEKLATLQQ